MRSHGHLTPPSYVYSSTALHRPSWREARLRPKLQPSPLPSPGLRRDLHLVFVGGGGVLAQRSLQMFFTMKGGRGGDGQINRTNQTLASESREMSEFRRRIIVCGKRDIIRISLASWHNCHHFFYYFIFEGTFCIEC